jgi:hypothetical protein
LITLLSAGFFLTKICRSAIIWTYKEKRRKDMEASITVADMMAALSALPPDARLVVTESGYYSYGELARVGLPEVYTVEGDEDDVPRGTVVYRIGHSHQSY